MLEQNTVFVLGAAFSKEMGLPLGEELKDIIRNMLPDANGDGGDSHLRQLLGLQDRSEFFRAASWLKTALPFAASIDNLVEHHQADAEIVQVAKWAIAAAISKREVESVIGPRHARDGNIVFTLPSVPTQSAYHDLFRLIVAGVPRGRLEQALSRLKVVTFNYDRTLEVFLARAIAAHSGVDLPSARQLVSNATILHAYGMLHPQRHGPAELTAFRKFDHPGEIEKAAEGIRTFSEKASSQEGDVIRGLIGQADRLVFLGCAFHRQNLDLIRPAKLRAGWVYGTVYVPAPEDPAGHARPPLEAFSTPTIATLRDSILEWAFPERPEFHLEPMTCRQLIAQHGVRWTV